jgi:hypothetical protein
MDPNQWLDRSRQSDPVVEQAIGLPNGICSARDLGQGQVIQGVDLDIAGRKVEAASHLVGESDAVETGILRFPPSGVGREGRRIRLRYKLVMLGPLPRFSGVSTFDPRVA